MYHFLCGGGGGGGTLCFCGGGGGGGEVWIFSGMAHFLEILFNFSSFLFP